MVIKFRSRKRRDPSWFSLRSTERFPISEEAAQARQGRPSAVVRQFSPVTDVSWDATWQRNKHHHRFATSIPSIARVGYDGNFGQVRGRTRRPARPIHVAAPHCLSISQNSMMISPTAGNRRHPVFQYRDGTFLAPISSPSTLPAPADARPASQQSGVTTDTIHPAAPWTLCIHACPEDQVLDTSPPTLLPAALTNVISTESSRHLRPIRKQLGQFRLDSTKSTCPLRT